MAVANTNGGSRRRGAEKIGVTVHFSKEEEAVSFTVDPEDEKDSHGEKCSCKRCWCGSCIPAEKRCCRIRHVIENKNVESAWKWGLKIVSSAVFPILSLKGYVREAYTLLLFLFALLTFTLALPTLIDHLKNRTGNLTIEVTRFVVSFLSVILAGIDMVFTFCNSGCRICRAGKAIVCALWRKEQLNFVDFSAELDKKESELKKYSTLNEKLDAPRIIIAEVLVYPILVCNVVENAAGKTYAGSPLEKFAFARFVLSVVKIFALVYLVRLLVIILSIIQLLRKRNESRTASMSNSTIGGEFSTDPVDLKHYSLRAALLLILFLVHVLGQMLSQCIMLAALWTKVSCENSELGKDTIYISPFTWAMIVGSFILPLVGTLTFFIPTYFWMVQFPVTFGMGILSTLRKKSISSVSNDTKDISKKILKIMKVVDKAKKRSCKFKCGFTFFAPHLTGASMLYMILVYLFLACSAWGKLPTGEFILCGISENGSTSYLITEAVVDSESQALTALYTFLWLLYTPFNYLISIFFLKISTWTIFYLVATAMLNMANMVTLLVGFTWVFIVCCPVAWIPPVVIAMCIYQNCIKFLHYLDYQL